MRLRTFLSLLGFGLTAILPSGRAADAPLKSGKSPELLLGTWIVDLRPTPSSPPYLKKLVITSVADGRLEGNFYDGSPLQAGRSNHEASDTLCFAFFTDPGEGAYQTSGRLVSPDRLEGMTLSTTRGFLLPWQATREKKSP